MSATSHRSCHPLTTLPECAGRITVGVYCRRKWITIYPNQCSDIQDRTSGHHEPHRHTFLPAHKYSTTLCYRAIVKIPTGNRKQFNVRGSGPCLRRTDDGTELCNPSLHDHTAGLVFDSNAPRSGPPSGLSPSLQERHLSDDFTNDDVPLPLVQIRTETAAPARFLSSFTKRLIKQIHLSLSRPAPFPYTCPTAFRSSPTTYSTIDNDIPSHSLLLPPSQISSCLSCFHGFLAGANMKLYATSAQKNHTPHILDDHSLPTLIAVHASLAISDGVGNCGKIDGSRRCLPNNSRCYPASFIPMTPSPELGLRTFSGDFLMHVVLLPPGHEPRGGCPTHTWFASKLCGWRDDNGRKCDAPVTYGCTNRSAAVYGLESIRRDIEIICRCCLTKGTKNVIQKNMSRRLREVDLEGTVWSDRADVHRHD